MQTLATAVALASGFALTGYDGRAAELLATSLAINLALAPLTAAVAARRGRSVLVWGAIGLGFGLWALAGALIFLAPKSRYGSPPAADSNPPDAA